MALSILQGGREIKKYCGDPTTLGWPAPITLYRERCVHPTLMAVEKINTNLAGLPPPWMKRAEVGGVPTPTETAIRKMMGEPLPRVVDPASLPPEIANLFAQFGVLRRIQKKLSTLSRRPGGAIVPAKGTIACVDDDDNIYMGVEFLESHKNEEDLLAGIMAHEWGHIVSDLPRNSDWSHVSWDELFAIRREEESFADAYAGRMLYKMGYAVTRFANFLEELKKFENRLQTHKYHNPFLRAEIVRQAFAAEMRTADSARKLFPGLPSNGLLLGVG